MDEIRIDELLDKLSEAREAGYGMIIDSFLEVQKDLDPNPAMLMKELEHFVQRVKTVRGDFSPHWHQDMNSRIDALASEVKDIYYAAVLL